MVPMPTDLDHDAASELVFSLLARWCVEYQRRIDGAVDVSASRLNPTTGKTEYFTAYDLDPTKLDQIKRAILSQSSQFNTFA